MSRVMQIGGELPRLRFTSGTVEALKWLALASMLVDHTNKVLFDSHLGEWATVIGRLAFPLFAVVMGYNLARPHADPEKLAKRLSIAGALVTPVYGLLFGWWPLNVLWTFAAAALVTAVHDRASFLPLGAGTGRVPWALIVLAGCFVDYLLPGLCLVLAVRAYTRRPGVWPLLGCTLALGGVCVLNGNAWALLALPVVWLLQQTSPVVPRLRWAFYAAYPLHLVVLVLLRG